MSATPAVVGGAVYFPDWGGYLHKVDSRTGKKLWSRRISDYTGRAGSLSRTSPAVRDGVVYVGEQVGGRLMAVSADTGRLIRLRQLDDHPYASLTASPVLVGNVVLQPVSSQEAGAAEDPNYVCCTGGR